MVLHCGRRSGPRSCASQTLLCTCAGLCGLGLWAVGKGCELWPTRVVTAYYARCYN